MSLSTVLKKNSKIWMDYFLSHQNQISMEENKKVQTGLQIFQMLDHLILIIKMVSLPPAGGREALHVFQKLGCNLIQATVLYRYKAAREGHCALQGLHFCSLDQRCSIRLSQGHN